MKWVHWKDVNAEALREFDRMCARRDFSPEIAFLEEQEKNEMAEASQ